MKFVALTGLFTTYRVSPPLPLNGNKKKRIDMKKFLAKESWAVFSLLLILICAGEVCALTNSERIDNILDSWKVDFGKLPKDFLDESKNVFLNSRENQILLLLAGGASVAMHNSGADVRIDNNFDHDAFVSTDLDEAINIVGGPSFHFAATGIWYSISAANEDDLNKERAWTMMKALSVTGASTLGLKLIRDNKTPNGKPLAWPSGHTSSSFCVASVLHEFYGAKVGVPAYVGASVVAWRMMDSGDHWASDVVFGATLGWVVGHSVASKGKLPEVAGYTVLPYSGSNSRRSVAGVSLFKMF